LSHRLSCICSLVLLLPFFLTPPATTQIYTLSLHDALPISDHQRGHLAIDGDSLVVEPLVVFDCIDLARAGGSSGRIGLFPLLQRSEEHTSELQSPCNLVCRLLLEKKKTTNSRRPPVPSPRS